MVPDSLLIPAAGLWEFPGQEVGVELDAVERRRSVDKYLNSMGCIYADGSQLQVLERRQVGETVHEFSHIRCTMRVDLLVLEVRTAWWHTQPTAHLQACLPCKSSAVWRCRQLQHKQFRPCGLHLQTCKLMNDSFPFRRYM